MTHEREVTTARTLPELAPTFHRPPAPAAGAPNVVMIVLDDLGFADFGCYGSAIATPTVDALAEHGLRYNNFHVTAMCSATRACLLTGRNHHAVGMGALANVPLGFPGYDARIPKSAASLARLLRDAGYSTFAVGKWHLAPQYETTPAGPFDRWPLGLGFERYYGFLGGMVDQWAPELVQDNGFLDPPQQAAERLHLTEDLAARAVRFIQDQQAAAPGKPFFLYLAPGAMHFPHQVPADWVEPYRGRFDEGWDVVRRETFDRQRQLGVVPEGAEPTGRPPWVAEWSALPSAERRLYSRMMEVYAGFLTHTDAQVGHVIDSLARLGVLDDTLILICSDNGASADGGPHGFLDWGGIFRVNDVAPMLERIDDLGGPDAYNHYAWGWAWAGNTPFKLWKEYTWLGGIRAPLVVHWPARIGPDHHGNVREPFCHAVDLMPTILDAAGVAAPAEVDGVRQQAVHGASALDTFTDPGAPSPRRLQYFEMLGSRALYHNGWKATTNRVVPFPAQRELVHGSRHLDTDEWSLFHVAQDFAEVHDVAAEHPERLRRMIELWWAEADRNQVLPLTEDAISRAAAVDGVALRRRNRYVWLPGGGPIALTSPLSGGFRLSADLETPRSGLPAGTVCALGYRHARWRLYLCDGRLVAEFHIDGQASRVVANDVVGPGRHAVGVSYRCPPDGGGTVTLTVDDREVGAGAVTLAPAQAEQLLLIGRDCAVSDDDQPPFAGSIHRVVLDVELAPIRPRDHVSSAVKQD